MIQLPFTTPEIAGDGQDQYLLGEGRYRLTFIHGTEMINRARANHQLNPAGTLLLGQAYLLALLASSTMKNEERIGLLVECDGEVDGISVEANAHGQVRGYLKESEIELAFIDDYDRLFRSGTLTLLRYAEDMRHPSRGQVELRPGSLAENVAWYYAHSEQTATLLDVNIHFDDSQRVAGAAGVLVQTLPGGDPGVLDQIADKLDSIRPSANTSPPERRRSNSYEKRSRRGTPNSSQPGRPNSTAAAAKSVSVGSCRPSLKTNGKISSRTDQSPSTQRATTAIQPTRSLETSFRPSRPRVGGVVTVVYTKMLQIRG
jgi:redox-regulated HSP33 family molecular chaperone